MKFLSQFLIIVSLLFSGWAEAEPWMASRFATTYSGVTLTCYACHTNPNGGGLRNPLGKSNEERWLRSLYFEGYRLNKPQDAKSVAVQDPMSMSQALNFNGGVDFRWFYLDTTKDTVRTKNAMPMGTDIGASVRPADHLQLVWEGRFASDPAKTNTWDEGYTTSSMVRSAYALFDDLPYNGYAMYGIYRPQFGNYNPDHTTIFSRATGLDYRASYKSIGVGVQPKRAFFNLNYLQPFGDRSFNQDRGFVFNAGLHFSAANGYLMASVWDTKEKDWTAGTDTHKQMNSLTGGLTKGRVTAVFDVTHILIATPTVRRDTGTVISVEPRVRVWNESYIKGGWEYLNTGPTLRLGHARELSAGVSTFLISGLEFELMYKEMKATELDVGTTERNYWAQLHLFY